MQRRGTACDQATTCSAKIVVTTCTDRIEGISIGSQGNLYVSTTTTIYAFDPAGTELWNYSPPAGDQDIQTSVTIAADGSLYFASRYALYALDSNGVFRWSYQTNDSTSVISAPVIGADDRIYFANAQTIHAVNNDGSLYWTHDGGSNRALTIDSAGRLYASINSNLNAFVNDSGGPADSPWPMAWSGPAHTSRVEDSDGDGLSDWDEVNLYLTDPDLADTDSDGLNDYEEVVTHLTDALVSDTDGDGLSDGDEVSTHGSDPNLADSDSDGLSDYDEVVTHGTSPVLADTDGDTLSDLAEINTHSTDPLEGDSDGDGYLDGAEINAGSDPLDNASQIADGFPQWWLDLNGPVLSAPAIGVDDTVYVATAQTLYAINADSTVRWTYDLAGSLFTDTLVVKKSLDQSGWPNVLDNIILIGDNNGAMYAFNRSGGLDWTWSQPDGDNITSITTLEGDIFPTTESVINSTTGNYSDWADAGTLDVADGVISTIAVISSEEMLYFGSSTGKLIAKLFDRYSNVGVSWSYELGEAIVSLSLGENSVLYVSTASALYAYDTAGTLLWTFNSLPGAGETILTQVSTAANGDLLFGSSHAVYSPDSVGSLNWSYSTGDNSNVNGAPAIGADGVIYLATDSAHYALNDDGTLNWSYTTGSKLPLTIDDTGRLYSVDGDRLYSFVNASGGLPVTPWPLFGANPQNSSTIPVDTDGDGLSDWYETYLYSTDPALADTDGEGLTDYEEIIIYLTDPLDTDTDNDTHNDFTEVNAGSDPLDWFSVPGV